MVLPGARVGTLRLCPLSGPCTDDAAGVLVAAKSASHRGNRSTLRRIWALTGFVHLQRPLRALLPTAGTRLSVGTSMVHACRRPSVGAPLASEIRPLPLIGAISVLARCGFQQHTELVHAGTIGFRRFAVCPRHTGKTPKHTVFKFAVRGPRQIRDDEFVCF